MIDVLKEQPRVLVIDDERGPRESLRILLKNDYEVSCVGSVDEGLAALAEDEPDLVILDIRMPGKSGIGACIISASVWVEATKAR